MMWILVPIVIVVSFVVGLFAINAAFRWFDRVVLGKAPNPPKRAKAYGWRVCYGCGFDLRGLGEEGKCPECGRGFSYEGLLESWGVMRDPRLGDDVVEVRDPGLGDDEVREGYPRFYLPMRWVHSALGCAVLAWVGAVVASGGLLERAPFLVISDVWPFVSVSMADGGVAAWYASTILAGLVFLAVAIGGLIVGSSRASREARAAGCRVCLQCGTKLSEDTDRGFCPGCGVPWTIEGLRKCWGERS